jgi:2-polyprenyl-6-hydroxyphenyl methylase/3-demethylubiquinone-9 3-methyltransferase
LLGDANLPERYAAEYEAPVRERIAAHLKPGVRVLDVGAGRLPFIAKEDRPENTHYTGLDISRAELDLAGDGYDESFVSDICEFVPELEGQFDVAVCFQVLEHVADVPAALENVRRYLKPGGTFVAQLSGARAPQALLMRLLPISVSRFLSEKILKFPADMVFPAHYDHCTFSGLTKSTAAWPNAEIAPRWIGATYFSWFKPFVKLAVKYEDWAIAKNKRNLASYFVIDAQA